jgi:hypothetical protein
MESSFYNELSTSKWVQNYTLSKVRFGKKPGDNIILQLPLGDKRLSNK